MSVVAIVGPTASGKSAIAEAVAERFSAVIVSVDSMQAYRDMDIGTAKPSEATRDRIPHRLVDIVDPEDALSVREYQLLGREALAAAIESHGRVVICGGSGLHFRSIVDPMTFAPTDTDVREEIEALTADRARSMLVSADPDAANHVDLDNPRRVVRALEVFRLTGATPSERAGTREARALAAYEPAIPFVGIGIDADADVGRRIEDRFDGMLRAGLLDEVAVLRRRLGPTARQGVGYKELVDVVDGSVSLREGRDAAIRATNSLVKRQRTYFRRDPRIRWIPWQDDEQRRIGDALTAIEERVRWTS